MPLLLLALALPTTVPPMREVARLVVARTTVERVVRRAVPTQETLRMVRTPVRRRQVKVKLDRTKPDSSSNKTASRHRLNSRRKLNNRHRPCKLRIPAR